MLLQVDYIQEQYLKVRENDALGEQICALAEDLKGTIEPNVLYSVELKPMHKAKGYVVVAATPVQFPATVETIIDPKTLYKVTVSFGNKPIYLDPKDGKSAMSRTLKGVLQILREHQNIENHKETAIGNVQQVCNQLGYVYYRENLGGFDGGKFIEV